MCPGYLSRLSLLTGLKSLLWGSDAQPSLPCLDLALAVLCLTAPWGQAAVGDKNLSAHPPGTLLFYLLPFCHDHWSPQFHHGKASPFWPHLFNNFHADWCILGSLLLLLSEQLNSTGSYSLLCVMVPTAFINFSKCHQEWYECVTQLSIPSAQAITAGTGSRETGTGDPFDFMCAGPHRIEKMPWPP